MAMSVSDSEASTMGGIPGSPGGVADFNNDLAGFGFEDSWIEEFTESANAFWTRTTTGAGSTAAWSTTSSTTNPWDFLTETLGGGAASFERIALAKPVQVLKMSRVRWGARVRFGGSVSTPAFFVGLFGHATSLNTTRANGVYLYKAASSLVLDTRMVKSSTEVTAAGLSLPSTVSVWHDLMMELTTGASASSATFRAWINGVPLGAISSETSMPNGTWLFPAFGLSGSAGESLSIASFGKAVSSPVTND